MSDIQSSLIGLTAPEAPIDPLVDVKFNSNLQLAHSISEASSSIVSPYSDIPLLICTKEKQYKTQSESISSSLLQLHRDIKQFEKKVEFQKVNSVTTDDLLLLSY